MSENMFDKFNDMFDVEGLKEDIDKAAQQDGEFEEVPYGDYEVKVVKLELGETGAQSKNPGSPKVNIWYEILTGDYKGQKIFQNQMLTSGFGIHKMNELLTSFESGVPVMFGDFNQYNELLKEIFTAIDGSGEYQLSYGENKKGYKVYEIVQRF